MENYYIVLGIEKDVSFEEIRKAYFSLVKIYHPDMNKDKSKKEQEIANQKFIKISKAHSVLSDICQRKEYDKKIHSNISNKWNSYFIKVKHFCNKKEWGTADYYIKLLTQISNRPIIRAYQAMINIYLHKDIQKNLDICNKLSNEHLFDTKFHIIKAKAFLGAGNKDEARFSIKEALKWDPDSKEAIELENKLTNKKSKKENLFDKFKKKLKIIK